jgi:hypothetical protein
MRLNAENVCEHRLPRFQMNRQLEETGRAIGATTRGPHITLCRPPGAFRLDHSLVGNGVLRPDGETQPVQCLPVRASFEARIFMPGRGVAPMVRRSWRRASAAPVNERRSPIVKTRRECKRILPRTLVPQVGNEKETLERPFYSRRHKKMKTLARIDGRRCARGRARHVDRTAREFIPARRKVLPRMSSPRSSA